MFVLPHFRHITHNLSQKPEITEDDFYENIDDEINFDFENTFNE